MPGHLLIVLQTRPVKSELASAMTMGNEHNTQDAVRRQAKDWVVHIATGEATAADLRELEGWRQKSPLHENAYVEASRLWRMLGASLQATARSSAIVSFPGAKRVGRRAFLGGTIASSAAAAAGIAIVRPPLHLWPSFEEVAADYRTGAGEQRTITLASQAIVELNTRTSLNIGKSIADSDSIELVAGEAAVSAGPGRVVVQAGSSRSAASNAEFTIRCDGSNVQVTCLSGLVEVDGEGGATILRAHQQLALTAENQGTITAVDPEIVAGWRNGQLIFDNEPLWRVIAEVNRYRAGRILLMNAALGERRISVRFKIARLDAVLIQFQEVFGAKVTSLGGGFVVLT